jgi:hypothetical protein
VRFQLLTGLSARRIVINDGDIAVSECPGTSVQGS